MLTDFYFLFFLVLSIIAITFFGVIVGLVVFIKNRKLFKSYKDINRSSKLDYENIRYAYNVIQSKFKNNF